MGVVSSPNLSHQSGMPSSFLYLQQHRHGLCVDGQAPSECRKQAVIPTFHFFQILPCPVEKIELVSGSLTTGNPDEQPRDAGR